MSFIKCDTLRFEFFKIFSVAKVLNVSIQAYGTNNLQLFFGVHRKKNIQKVWWSQFLCFIFVSLLNH